MGLTHQLSAVLAGAVAASSAAAAPTASHSFSQWMAAHGKSYATREELVARRRVFAANAARVAAHNAEAEQGAHTYTLSVDGQWADLTAAEFVAALQRDGALVAPSLRKGGAAAAADDGVALPTSVDWSAKGDVTPVVNQGAMGAAWAIAAVGTLESNVAIARGALVPLSVQQLTDCADQTTWQSYLVSKGLCSAADYPPSGASGGTCRDGTCVPVAVAKAMTPVPAQSEPALMQAAAAATAWVAVEADQPAFQLYAGGVLTAPCGALLNHALQLVGYGTDTGAGGDYWKVKNSWGVSWGEKGYMRMGRGRKYGPDGQCGIQTFATYPVVA